MRDLFPKFCHRTRFNRIRRNLHAVIEEIRKELSNLTGYKYEQYRVIDSIPYQYASLEEQDSIKPLGDMKLLTVHVLQKKKLT